MTKEEIVEEIMARTADEIKNKKDEDYYKSYNITQKDLEKDRSNHYFFMRFMELLGDRMEPWAPYVNLEGSVLSPKDKQDPEELSENAFTVEEITKEMNDWFAKRNPRHKSI